MRRNIFPLLASIIYLVMLSATINTTQAQLLIETDEPADVEDGILVDKNGMTLYTYDKDLIAPSKSVCSAQCAVNWPPFQANEGDQTEGDWSIIDRDDNTKQWAYKGQPLYHWIKDTSPGDEDGEGMAGNTWHVAKP